MTDKPSIPRREFVSKASAGVAFTIVPRRVLGGPGYQAPSDTLNVACIGVGGMGRNDVRGVSSENVYALCDVDSNNSAQTLQSYPGAKLYEDFRVMLEQEGANIDAVTVSTPDHTHAVAAAMALRMGKHTYCQKPLARTIHEVRHLEAAARRAGVATQMGNQGHAGDGTRRLREWIEAGAIGTVREVHYWTNRPIWPQGINRPLEQYHVPRHLNWDLWLGPAPFRPFAPGYAHFNWRGWWDFGTGALGDIACHAMDAAFWTLDLAYPTRIEAESTELFAETAPKLSRIVYHFPERNGRAPVKVVWRDGGLLPPKPREVESGESWSFPSIGGQLWVGDDGKLVAGVYGEEPRLVDRARHAELTANPPAQRYPRTDGVYAEWINACKGGTPAGSDFATHAGPLTEMVLLGNLAVRSNRDLDIDPETGDVTNGDIPAEYVQPAYRRGWEL